MSIEAMLKKLKKEFPKEFFITFSNVFNPNSYKELVNTTMRNSLSYFFTVVFLSFIVMILFSLPIIANLKGNFQREFAKFDEFTIDINSSMSEPIYIKQLGLGIDTESNRELKRENLLITDDYLQMRACYLAPWCIFDKRVVKIELDDYKNLVEKQDDLADLFMGLYIIALPMLVILVIAFLFVKYFLLIVVLWLLGILLLRIIKRKLSIHKVFKICMYASTPMVILDTVNIPLGYQLFSIPMFVSIIYFVIGIMLVSERGFK